MTMAYLCDVVVELTKFDTVFTCRIGRCANIWFHSTSKCENIVSQNNPILRKKFSFHNHIVIINIIFLIRIDENNIEWSVESGKAVPIRND